MKLGEQKAKKITFEKLDVFQGFLTQQYHPHIWYFHFGIFNSGVKIQYEWRNFYVLCYWS